MSLDPAQFRQALSQFATGVTVVTTTDSAERPLGLTVSSFSSVSLDPPLVLVCVDWRSETHAGFRESGRFGVSVLAENQVEVSRRFAGAVEDKFSDFEMKRGAHGCLLVPGSLARLECRVVAAHEAGDHVIYVGELLGLEVEPGLPLLYHSSAYTRLALEGPAGSRAGHGEPDRV